MGRGDFAKAPPLQMSGYDVKGTNSGMGGGGTQSSYKHLSPPRKIKGIGYHRYIKQAHGCIYSLGVMVYKYVDD